MDHPIWSGVVIGLVSQPPIKEIDASKNKGFHAETIVDYDNISYSNQNLTNELPPNIVHSDNYFNADGWKVNIPDFNGLDNPTEKNPISIAEFLGKYLDIYPIKNVFESLYGDLNYHYRYPLQAMIKASMIRRIKCLRSFQKLVNRFDTNHYDAKHVGFENNGNGRPKIPDRRTFRHWENVRVNNKTLEKAMDKSIIEIRKNLEKQGIKLGKNIAIDSTPLESLFNDDDAKYNGHYDKFGYKIHGAYDIDYNIPLAIIVTPMDKGDSPYFKKLLKKLDNLGIKFEKVFADGAYDSYYNFAFVHVKYHARFYTNLGKKAKFNEKGKIEIIEKEYNRLRSKPGFLPADQVSLLGKMQFLMKYGRYEYVGAYFRNQLLKTWVYWKKKQRNQDHILYNDRNAAEGFHGFAKQCLNLQNYFDYKGKRNVERHVRWTYLSVLGVALARVQNGITKNLAQIAYFE